MNNKNKVWIAGIMILLLSGIVYAESGSCDNRWDMAKLHAITKGIEKIGGGACWIQKSKISEENGFKLYGPGEQPIEYEYEIYPNDYKIISIEGGYSEPWRKEFLYPDANFEDAMQNLKENFGVENPYQFCMEEYHAVKWEIEDDGSYRNPGIWWRCNVYFPAIPSGWHTTVISKEEAEQFEQGTYYRCGVFRDPKTGQSTCMNTNWDIVDSTPEATKVSIFTNLYYYFFGSWDFKEERIIAEDATPIFATVNPLSGDIQNESSILWILILVGIFYYIYKKKKK